MVAATTMVRTHINEARHRASRTWRWWLAVTAAAIVVVVVAIAFLLLRRRDDTVSRLVRLAAASARLAEPRLSGGFAWARYRGPMRAGDAGPDSGLLRLDGAAGEAIERAQSERSGDARHAAGIALVLVDQPAEAIGRLRDAAAELPNDASVWNDFAAARYAAAVKMQRPSLLPEALAAADRALRVDSKSAEALFNRALILQRLGLRSEAHAAWERYLAVDSSSPWSNEGREHLSHLPLQSARALFQKELPRLERAAVAGDATAVTQIVAQFPQQCRTHAEAELLGLWGEASRRGDTAESGRLLIVARAIGDALASLHGESLLREAVAAIDRSDGTGRGSLAEAHATYRRGRIAYANQRIEAGERDLRDAAARFAGAGSPMRFSARYYAAEALYDRHQSTTACAEQAQTLRELEQQPHFTAMRAQVAWALAVCRMVDTDWTGAAPLLAESERGFRALGERTNLGVILGLKATTFTFMGLADDAWTARIEGFDLLSAEGHADRLAVSLGAAARSELQHGRLEAALPILELVEAADRGAANEAVLDDALFREAVLNAALGDEARGSLKVREAESVAQGIRDPAARERALAGVAFAHGAVVLRRDPSEARRFLTSAIEGYRAQGATALLPEPYLLRARASMRLGDTAAAMRDLDDGIAIVERHSVDVAGTVVGTGVLDAGTALFEEAVNLQVDRGDAPAVFAYAERARTQLRGDGQRGAQPLQQQLAGTGTAVLEFVALPSALVAVCVTERGIIATRTPIARERLERLADGNDLAALNDVLIAPAALDGVRQLVVVPDPRLEGVPFAALYERRTKRYLIERMPVSIALSATSLQRGNARAPRSLLAITLPSGGPIHTAALPESESELLDIRNLYGRFTGVPAAEATFAAFLAAAPRADVVHIAGHTERQPGAGDPALVFADERVSGKRMARTSLFDGATVVLAACETLRAPRQPQVHTLSLGGGFLAAGAASVVGTLTPIADRDARLLFAEVHRELAAGADPAAAVRAAQLSAIARGDRSAWESIALLTRRIPTTNP